ncbi:PREDICTED: E3 ubiquitin-protein ligase AMFR-like [Nicrophorus vespilloides]|uniref:E3 ubiquitin-protein ligase AMFR-like n=1 Tax=Nicrophorus vespilloides TaxID=110193 RepID=A0ABM1NEF3_NICVS|nr:PREDICTED: E3 ubiquitin-protein ligase AMFR-like [Nicrophorus vespilloides]
MPLSRFDRVPLPNLKTYTFLSVLALSGCVYFAKEAIKDPDWNIQDKVQHQNSRQRDETFNISSANDTSDSERSLKQWVSDMSAVMTREPICVWVLINMAICWLILVGRCIQRMVFGDLRVSEHQHLKDKFWNFVFYKFIFVFGVINVQYVEEVLLWCSWFALLGFLQLIAQLAKDRFEYLSFSASTPIWSHVKLMGLLTGIFVISSFMLLVAIFVGYFIGFNTFAFMSAEVILLSIRTLHVILRYGLHLYDIRTEDASGVNPTSPSGSEKVWEKRGPITYYTELVFELSALSIDFLHHIHMLLWSNIFLSMASLVICMQLRYLFQEMQRRIKKHRNYLWVRNHLEQNYPMASSEELSENSDNCAICWENMDCARKLPCGHLFHNTCLQSWLEQDTSCPTCRFALSIQNPSSSRMDAPPHDLQQDNQQPIRRELNHFFHFDGSRYVSWLPSFFVEVRPPQLMRTSDVQNSQLDAMGRQVQQLFPNLPLSTIVDDLRNTRSVEVTIENVLDGRLVAPSIFHERNDHASSPSSSTVLPQSSVPSPSAPSSSSSTRWEAANPVETEDNVAGRFSKSPEERERILHKRMEHLIQTARKRYIDKQHSSTETHS